MAFFCTLFLLNKAKKNINVKDIDVLQWMHSLYSSLSADLSDFQSNDNSDYPDESSR